MKKEKNRFSHAIDWLRKNAIIHDQKDMAQRMGVTEATISRNKHGSVKRPDEDTLYKFNDQFGDIINLAYLRGESDVMLMSDVKKNTENKPLYPSDALAAVVAAKDETIATLRAQLSDKDCTIAAKDKIIAANEVLIRNLQQQILELHTKATIEKGHLTAGTSPSVLAEKKVQTHPNL